MPSRLWYTQKSLAASPHKTTTNCPTPLWVLCSQTEESLGTSAYLFPSINGEVTEHLNSFGGRMTPLQLIMFYISCCVSSPLIHKFHDASSKQLFSCQFLLMIPKRFPYIWAWWILLGFSNSFVFPILPSSLLFSLFYDFHSVPDFTLLAFAPRDSLVCLGEQKNEALVSQSTSTAWWRRRMLSRLSIVSRRVW